MKPIRLAFILCLFITNAFTQNNTTGVIPVIKIPDFDDPTIKKFYQSYADHLTKCIIVIRENNEAKATALFKDPGEQLVKNEKIIAKELVKDPIEKQKYIQFATQLYPYIKELEGSVYFKKLYGK